MLHFRSYTNESILFEINEDSPECAIDNEVFDLLYNHVPQEIKNPCPKDMNYAQFRNGMVKVNEQMYKKIIKLGKVDEINLERTALSYEYSMFLEGQEDPFVSSVLSGEPGLINVREGQEPNAGIYLALDSMTMNEEALFWISFELMYGKLG